MSKFRVTGTAVHTATGDEVYVRYEVEAPDAQVAADRAMGLYWGEAGTVLVEWREPPIVAAIEGQMELII